MPRLIQGDRCPHCGVALGDPKPRVCPSCGGSLQQRFLRAGCLSTAPLVLVSLTALGALLRELL